jgi:hypothetical protein
MTGENMPVFVGKDRSVEAKDPDTLLDGPDLRGGVFASIAGVRAEFGNRSSRNLPADHRQIVIGLFVDIHRVAP